MKVTFDNMPSAVELLINKISSLENELRTIAKTDTNTEQYLSRTQVSKMLDVDVSTLHNWKHKGFLIPIGIGNRIYYRKSDVEKAMKPLSEKKTDKSKPTFTAPNQLKNVLNLANPNAIQIIGVYFLIKDDLIVYVGASTNVFKRVSEHSLDLGKDFDSWYYLPCSENNLFALEMALIKRFQPVYNLKMDKTELSKTELAILEKSGIVL